MKGKYHVLELGTIQKFCQTNGNAVAGGGLITEARWRWMR